MATITTGDFVSRPTDAGTAPNNWQSDVAAVADTVEAVVERMSHPHVYIGVVLLDSGGNQVDTVSAGSFEVSVKLWSTGRWESPETSTLQANGLVTTSVRGPIQAIRVVPSSIPSEEAPSYVVRLTGFRS